MARQSTELRKWINDSNRKLMNKEEVEEYQTYKELPADEKVRLINDGLTLISNDPEFADAWLKLRYEQKCQVADLAASYLYRRKMDDLTARIRAASIAARA